MDAIGLINFEGNTIISNSDLTFNKSVGKIFGKGIGDVSKPHVKTITNKTVLSDGFFYAPVTGAASSVQNAVDPSIYDDLVSSFGSLPSVTVGNWTN